MNECNASELDPHWCPTTTDETLPSVLGCLPQGPAWDGALLDGTVMNQYWRSFASVLAFVYARCCAFLDEFHCGTVKESFDQWAFEYALGDPCDPYGKNLCEKVQAIGGQTCDYLVNAAHKTGWVISCVPQDTNEPMCGAFVTGCTGLEYKARPVSRAFTAPRVPPANSGAVMPFLPVDALVYPSPAVAFTQPVIPTDSSGAYFATFSQAWVWEVTVDMRASATLQGISYSLPDDPPFSAAGNFVTGCTPLCTDLPSPQLVLCVLDNLKPAHAILITHLLYT